MTNDSGYWALFALSRLTKMLSIAGLSAVDLAIASASTWPLMSTWSGIQTKAKILDLLIWDTLSLFAEVIHLPVLFKVVNKMSVHHKEEPPILHTVLQCTRVVTNMFNKNTNHSVLIFWTNRLQNQWSREHSLYVKWCSNSVGLHDLSFLLAWATREALTEFLVDEWNCVTSPFVTAHGAAKILYVRFAY